MSTNRIFRNVYLETQRQLTALIDVLVKTLEHFGFGGRGDRQKFERELRKTLLTLATCPEDEAPLSTLRVSGSVTDKRRTHINEVLLGFGADEGEAERMTNTILDTDPNLIGVMTREGTFTVRRNRQWRVLSYQIAALYHDARRLYDRLKDVLEDVREPYRGTERDPGEGVEQVCELLERFPDMADPVYQKAGLTGITAYPPQRQGTANYEARIFEREAQEYIDSQWWWDVFKVAGLVVAAIAITVVTGFVASPLAATLVGAGIGLAQGGAMVYSANQSLTEVRDANLYGAASDARVEIAEGEVTGAWGALVVNVATMGVVGRFGGGPAVSAMMRTVRVTALSAAGGGLTAATNPNVWRSENTGGLILFGTIIGGVSGAAGQALASGAARVVPALGGKVQIGVHRHSGPLEKGRTVRVQLGPDDAPVTGKVVAVNTNDNTVMVKVDGQNLHVRIGKVAKVEGSMFDESVQRQALRPMTGDDLGDVGEDMTRSFMMRDGEPVFGWSARGKDGRVYFQEPGGNGPRPIEAGDVMVYDSKLHAKAVGVDVKDLEFFEPHQHRMSIQPVPGNSQYFVARNPTGPRRLHITTGATQDHNGAFRNWDGVELPQYIMRGRPGMSSPVPEEIAFFGAHGSTRGFAGINTRQAARSVVDAIVTTNRSTASSGQAPIRFCSLRACSQGSKRFLLWGRTNAEDFQSQVNMRLRELGIDPNGPNGITVLAADRMGATYGGASVKVNGRFETTPYVPAGTQQPLAYRPDVSQGIRNAVVGGLKISGIIIAIDGGIGAAALGVAYIADPERTMEILQELKDKVVGIIFEADNGAATTLQPNMSVQPDATRVILPNNR